ncbi:response regulator transcription factor [Paenibacillus sp. y28]|uniref:response regulator transcription factor n=1 Tax=Paenibacillus sp. y28 TaxID=3129110 RepID=UPI00301964C9
MYKVMLVDDERIILEGISNVVDWEACGTVLAATARNGLEALDRMAEHLPDIVISDIKMPGMDGLELVAQSQKLYPNTQFILLSGFSEFEYARTAMQYGVKHYLLKPCNENVIMDALKECAKEISTSETREHFIQNMKYGLQKILPHVKEQFLKEFVTNKTYGTKDWEYYRQLFDLNSQAQKIRLILFQLEGDFEFEHMFAIKNIAEDILGKTILSTTIGDHVLILIEEEEDTASTLQERIVEIRKTFKEYYKKDTTIALSEPDTIAGARKLYRETLECINYRFYLGEGSLITKQDVWMPDAVKDEDFSFDSEQLYMAVKTGQWDEASGEIEHIFNSLNGLRLSIPMTKSYVIQMYMAMIRLGEADRMEEFMQKLPVLAEMHTLQTIEAFFRQVAEEITLYHYEKNKNKHSAIIQKVIETINEHMGNPDLSIHWIAQTILFMNPDYVGKLFKKETGERFSNYVMKIRINKAIELIEASDDVKIFELADKLGFGENPQYFSQVFKKYTGLTPTEYKRNP